MKNIYFGVALATFLCSPTLAQQQQGNFSPSSVELAREAAVGDAFAGEAAEAIATVPVVEEPVPTHRECSRFQ